MARARLQAVRQEFHFHPSLNLVLYENVPWLAGLALLFLLDVSAHIAISEQLSGKHIRFNGFSQIELAIFGVFAFIALWRIAESCFRRRHLIMRVGKDEVVIKRGMFLRRRDRFFRNRITSMQVGHDLKHWLFGLRYLEIGLGLDPSITGVRINALLPEEAHQIWLALSDSAMVGQQPLLAPSVHLEKPISEVSQIAA